MISPARTRTLFNYADGVLYWAVSPGRRCPVGTVAGHRRSEHASHPNSHIIQVAGHKYARARLVFAWHHGTWPEGRLYHANDNPHDDRIENLSTLLKAEREANASSIINYANALSVSGMGGGNNV